MDGLEVLLLARCVGGAQPDFPCGLPCVRIAAALRGLVSTEDP